jgi:uncharacterized protein (DUF58 family)
MSITGRFALLLALCAVAAVFAPPIVAIGIAALLIVAAVIDATTARQIAPVERTLPSVISRGVPAELRIRVTRPTGSHTRVRQPLPPDARLDTSEVTGTELATNLTMIRRGRHDLPPAAVSQDGPLGLGRWLHRPGTSARLTVYPDMHAAWRILEEVRRGRFGDPGKRTRGPLGLGTDFESVRKYHSNDDVRLVNWKASARLGVPMSNNLRVEQDKDVYCCVDAGRLTAGPTCEGSTVTRLDALFDAVVAVALVADEVGDRIGLVAFADRVLRWVNPHRKTGQAVVDGCIDVEPLLVDSDYVAAFARIGAVKRATVMVFTDIYEPAAAEPLLAAMPGLVRRHSVIVASIDDVDLQTLSQPSGVFASQDLGAARQVLAADVMADRARTIDILRAAGAVVVTAAPEAFATEVVRAYLRVKRGR